MPGSVFFYVADLYCALGMGVHFLLFVKVLNSYNGQWGLGAHIEGLNTCKFLHIHSPHTCTYTHTHAASSPCALDPCLLNHGPQRSIYL